MHALTLFTTILVLGTKLVPASPLPQLLVPLESEIISLTAAAGLNTSSVDMHHIFQTINMLSKANEPALAAAHKMQELHKLKSSHTNFTLSSVPTINSAAGLCKHLTSDHRRVVWDMEHHSMNTAHVKNTTTAAVTDTVAGSTETTEITVKDQDRANYNHCMRFATKGLRDARTLAQMVLAMQMESKALGTGVAGGIEARRLKFWIFADWWVEYLCEWQPTWCHEEKED